MEYGIFNIGIKDGILIVKCKKHSVTLQDVKEIRDQMQESTGLVYDYVIWDSLLGYYNGYDFNLKNYIFCGSLNESYNINKVKAYIKNDD